MSLPKRAVAILIQFRWALVAVAAIGLAVAWEPSTRIQMDRSLLALFADDDPAAAEYRLAIERLGDVPVVMLVYREPELATPQGIERNRMLTERVSSIGGVRGVLSPSILNDMVSKLPPFGKQPALFDRSSKVARGFDTMFSGYTHSANQSHAAVAVILDPSRMDQSIGELRDLASTRDRGVGMPAGKIEMVGEPVLLDDAFDLIERDGNRLAILVVTLLGGVLLITLRDVRVVLLALAMIVWSVVVTRALMVAMSIPMSLVSSVLISIVAIISATSALHWGIAASRQRRLGRSPLDAARGSLQNLLSPIGWTCATTAAGFLALTVSRIVPVQQFGIMIGVATGAVWLSLLLIGPVVMSVRPTFGWATGWALGLSAMAPPKRLVALAPPRRRRATFAERRATVSRRWASMAIRYRLPLLSVAAAFTVLSGYWTFGARIESNFLNNFRPQSSIAAAYREVENHLGGSGVWDVVLDAPADLDSDYLDDVRKLESRLRAIRVDGGVGLSKVLSLADADRVAQEAPLMGFVGPSTRLALMRTSIPTFYDALMSQPRADGMRSLRIMLRSHEDLDAGQKMALIDAVRSEVSCFESGSIRGGLVSGYYVLMTGLVRSLIDDQWRCLLVSSLAIAVLLGFATRSVRDVAAALPTNLAPIVWILGTAAITTGRLNMGAAMIGACAIGLSIDGSVHYLIARRRATINHPERSAVQIAVMVAGKIGVPVILATIALILGFGGLTTSQFVPTSTFGGLLAITLGIATLANLTILPAIVTMLTPANSKMP